MVLFLNEFSFSPTHQENEAEPATPGCLRTALNEIGLLELADQVFPDADGNN